MTGQRQVVCAVPSAITQGCPSGLSCAHRQFQSLKSRCLRRWIYKQLLPEDDKMADNEPDSDRASALRQAQALETQLLLTGRREIDGPMEGSSGGYPPDYLVEDVQDLSRGQRYADFHHHVQLRIGCPLYDSVGLSGFPRRSPHACCLDPPACSQGVYEGCGCS